MEKFLSIDFFKALTDRKNAYTTPLGSFKTAPSAWLGVSSLINLIVFCLKWDKAEEILALLLKLNTPLFIPKNLVIWPGSIGVSFKGGDQRTGHVCSASGVIL
ncbi:hypothetical protein MTR67_015676 [Solanum verrucosum]|uniref:Uncharacterized protein n=1 Tax=Solanum verrucosum TaxID=315347 RepID=A0AAF0QFG4_SOLVR|nr:hypothetical protein MTR67_015676 [Solanum verrucosum]